jgi:hypothetical protein
MDKVQKQDSSKCMTPTSKPFRIVFLVLHTRPVPDGPTCNYFRDTTGRFWPFKWVIASLRIKFKAEHQQLYNDNAVMFISMDFRFSLRLFRDVAPCNLVKLTDLSDVRTDSVIKVLKMEAVNTSETPVSYLRDLLGSTFQKTVTILCLLCPRVTSFSRHTRLCICIVRQNLMGLEAWNFVESVIPHITSQDLGQFGHRRLRKSSLDNFASRK